MPRKRQRPNKDGILWELTRKDSGEPRFVGYFATEPKARRAAAAMGLTAEFRDFVIREVLAR